jgi:hypothetical protein
MGGWPHPSTGDHASGYGLWKVLLLLCGVFQLMSSPWGPGRLLLFWQPGLSGCYPPVPHLTLLHTSVQFPAPLCISSISSHTWFFLSPPFSIPPNSLPLSASFDYIVPPSKGLIIEYLKQSYLVYWDLDFLRSVNIRKEINQSFNIMCIFVCLKLCVYLYSLCRYRMRTGP